MNTLGLLADPLVAGGQILRAEVRKTQANGQVDVLCNGEADKTVRCQVLQCSEGAALKLSKGELVLCWLSEPEDTRGVILGRIGAPKVKPQVAETPAELVLEAKNNLTLKCGEGSITFRKDGKILIKGKDLVSHAQRCNRIKGGSVAIN